MELLDLIKERRSIRRFKKEEVEKEKLELILEAAKWAPSAGNLQARDFIPVRDKGLREKLARAAYLQGFVSEAPLVLVVCANREKSESKYGSRGALYSLLDAALSIQNILLMVHFLGLGTCYIGAFDENSVREILGIPKEVIPVAILPIGYSDESPSAPPREMNLHREGW